MSVRIVTTELLGLLNDLVLTAQSVQGAAGYAGILLYTDRVDEGSEPGATNCLIGASSSGEIIGHGWTAAGGDLAPTLLPIQYVQPLRMSLNKLLTKENRETHVTELRRDGSHIVIAEEPDLFNGGWSAQFAFGDLDDWPRNVFALLSEVHLTAPADMKPVENRTDFPANRLAPFLTIASHRKSQVSLYRAHQGLNVHVQIGFHYRGLLVPSSGWNDSSGEGRFPDCGVYAPDLPPIKAAEEAEPAPSLA